MSRSDNLDLSSLKEKSGYLESYGYCSLLLTYDPMGSDNLIKIARVMNLDHKIKYMIAIRPYAVSPEYFGMLCRGFDEIQKDRIMINIVSGSINENETFLEDIVGIAPFIKYPEQRRFYTEEWLSKFLNLKFMKVYPEILISGHSDFCIDIAKKNNLFNIASWFNYKDSEGRKRFQVNSKQMISFAVVIRDSIEEYDKFIENLNEFDKHGAKWTIHGTKNMVKSQIINLYNEGVKDFQITTFYNDDRSHEVHQLTKEIREEINGKA